ncbi:DNA alkylation repair protein [Lujinxingia litoralis]|nr:DNA alkylation repair protein [Lujinxingia litoralis]
MMSPPLESVFARELAREVDRRLRAVANPDDAAPMAAYLKGIQPFVGVKAPARRAATRDLSRRFQPADARELRQALWALWELPYREARYTGIEWIEGLPREARGPELIDLYEAMIREGAWWDVVDAVCARLVSPLYLRERPALYATVERWATDEDLWVRRAALLAQLKHRDEADAEQLFRFCAEMAPEKAFFIRKAIGWGLREYACYRPRQVRDFLIAHRERLSGLSVREASKHLEKLGAPLPKGGEGSS